MVSLLGDMGKRSVEVLIGKQGGLWTLWPEMIGFFLLIVGFLFSFTTVGSTAMSYIVILLWGMMFGRLWYKCRNTFRFPMVIIIMGFLVGYVAASFLHGYGRPFLLSIAFLVGMIISHKLHSTKAVHGVDW